MTEDSKPSTIGPVGAQVVANIEQLRQVRGLSLAALSDRLTQVGQSIHANVLHRLSQGRRRVDADDLLAFAVALKVPPSAILLPRNVGRNDPVGLTPAVSAPAWVAWEWMDGQTYLPEEEVDDSFELDPGARADFVANGRPVFDQRNNPAIREAAHLVFRLKLLRDGMATKAGVRRQLERVVLEIAELLGDD